MNSSNGGDRRAADWVEPRVQQEGLQRYVQTLRERKWLIALTVLLTTLAAVAYVVTAEPVYEAEADLLITPVARDDTTLTGLGLIRDSSDPTRDVETAARLVTTTDVARRVRRELELTSEPRDLLRQVSAVPVAQSNIVAITARGSSPGEARDLANAFGTAAVADRTGQLHRQLDRSIEDLRRRIGQQGPDAATGPGSLRAQLTQLQTLRTAPDPTMRLETRADAPNTPVSPRTRASIAAGLLAGLILGVGGAFALRVLDPRLRREDQLRELFSLPILARIPRETRAGDTALMPGKLSTASLEAYRALRATLALTRSSSTSTGGPRSILVSSASGSEGKSTTAINLASSLALAGNRVILIEADLRRPSVGPAFGIHAERGTGSVLFGTETLEDCLITTKAYSSYLRLLLADKLGGWMADQLMLPAAQQLVARAKELADFVVIDSPPLAEVIDALPLTQTVDEVVLVVRLGRTQLSKLAQTGELLAQHGVNPAGFAVVGVPPTGEEGYYYTPAKSQRTPAALLRR
jgi:capsular exopolysaccharide synthesis family protein